MALKRKTSEKVFEIEEDVLEEYEDYQKECIEFAEALLNKLSLPSEEVEALEHIASHFGSEEEATVFLYKCLDWSRGSKTRRTL